MKCDICDSVIGVKKCEDPRIAILCNRGNLSFICINCIKKCNSKYRDMVLVYSGLKCELTKKGAKFIEKILKRSLHEN